MRRVTAALALSLILHAAWAALSHRLAKSGARSARHDWVSVTMPTSHSATARSKSAVRSPIATRQVQTVAQLAARPAAQPAEATAGDHWSARLRARVQEELRYPLALRRRGIEGRVQLALARAGDQLRPSLAISSGSDDLDRLALEAAQRATEGFTIDSVLPERMVLPVDFKL